MSKPVIDDPFLHDMIFNKEPVPNKNGGEGGSGENYNNAMPVTESMAAWAVADMRPAYFPAASKDVVQGLAAHAQAYNHEMGLDVSPSPMGNTFPDHQRDNSDPDFKREKQVNPNIDPSSSTAPDGSRVVILEENNSHAYHLNGKIDGQTVSFLLDTGATQVSIPHKLAASLGIEPNSRRGTKVTTANGTIEMFTTTIKRLEIGDIILEHVSAIINPGDNGNTLLLGMSALRDLEFTQRNGQLILKQYPKR